MLAACNRPGLVERKIAAAIRHCAKDAPCIIRPRDLTTFDWDKFAQFDGAASREEMERVLGMRLPKFTEFTRRLVFVKDRRVVYFEVSVGNIEHPQKDEVIFDRPDGKYISFSADSAFEVHVETSEEGNYYLLRPTSPAR